MMVENIRPYYEHAGITIYHGDCRDVLRGFPSESTDSVITDPPYLVSYRGRWGSEWGVIEGDTEASWLSSSVFRSLASSKFRRALLELLRLAACRYVSWCMEANRLSAC